MSNTQFSWIMIGLAFGGLIYYLMFVSVFPFLWSPLVFIMFNLLVIVAGVSIPSIMRQEDKAKTLIGKHDILFHRFGDLEGYHNVQVFNGEFEELYSVFHKDADRALYDTLKTMSDRLFSEED